MSVTVTTPNCSLVNRSGLKVRIRSARPITSAMICGDEPERALLLAAVEAAEHSGRAAVLGDIGEFICRLEEKSSEERVRSSKLAAATAVRFESMKKETVDLGSLGG
jgi:predicted dinucleotide-utilizing enzyme